MNRVHRWRSASGVRTDLARGVALLEMLVALTVLATAGAVLFGWVAQSSVQLQRLNNQQTQALMQLQVLQFVRGLNPAMTPRGRQAFVDFELSWEASAKTPMLNALDSSDAQTTTQIAIFDVRLTLQRPGQDQPWLVFSTQLPGWLTAVTARGSRIEPGMSGSAVK